MIYLPILFIIKYINSHILLYSFCTTSNICFRLNSGCKLQYLPIYFYQLKNKMLYIKSVCWLLPIVVNHYTLYRFPRLCYYLPTFTFIIFLYDGNNTSTFFWYINIILCFYYLVTPVWHKSLESNSINTRTRCPCIAIVGNGRVKRQWRLFKHM